jgi:eukaryotic-like serine/threonine-protein kinase
MKCPQCQTDISDDSRFCSKCGTPVQAAERIAFSQTRTILRPMEELTPETLLAGKYRILKVIGRGGMGIVYEAEDTKLQRHVALKFLPPELVLSQEARERFVLEARAAAALSHPNICTIYEIHDEGEKPFIAMEYIEGQSLKAKMAKNPIRTEEALNVAIQISEGLEEAHKKGIIHRDIKSANIMVTDGGQTKIMDFGLAKVKGGTVLTREGTTLGTVAYMSPEQALGKDVDQRTDIWSLGVVLYELLSGKLPFQGDHEASILYAVVHEEPKPLKAVKPDVALELQHAASRALKKNPEARYSSAQEMGKDLKKFRDRLKGEAAKAFSLPALLRSLRRPLVALPTAIAFLAIVLAAVWFFNRQAKVRWSREQAIPEIERLVDQNDLPSAYRLAIKADRYTPNDPRLVSYWSNFSEQVTVNSDPPAANIYRKFYAKPDEDWEYLGKAPVHISRFPYGYSRLRFEKEGFREGDFAVYSGLYFGQIQDTIFRLYEEGSVPDEMVRVPGRDYKLSLNCLDHLPAVHLDDYLIDKHEVTNREFKSFVDGNGYGKKDYWEFPFVKDGRVLTWEEAMSEFKDKTGRPGPATWEMSDYPEGQENYPVTGISWYEASAYAAFAGKSLPTVYHWNAAAGTETLVPYVIPLSNFDNKGPVPVGERKGMSAYGIDDMAGNVREWCGNQTGDSRYILGGGWDDQVYLFNWAFTQPAMDRSPTNGFRCVKYLGTNENLEALKAAIALPYRDFTSEKPISEEILKVYLGMYTYDKKELNSEVESTDGTDKEWVKEKISFNAAYGNERVTAYLFLPKAYRPPYQAVIYFPGSNAMTQRSSESLPLRLFDFIIKSGRAFMYPVYKSTHERGDGLTSSVPDETNSYKEHVIQWAKDLGRSIDYLESRRDISADKLAYYGYSWGARLGGLMPAVEKRIKVALLVLAGFRFQRSKPEVDPFYFVSRIKIPVLMLNGKYDGFFPVETSQVPMFNLFGTPAEQKRRIVYETGHNVPRDQLIKETMEWLDRYLGPVNRN